MIVLWKNTVGNIDIKQGIRARNSCCFVMILGSWLCPLFGCSAVPSPLSAIIFFKKCWPPLFRDSSDSKPGFNTCILKSKFNDCENCWTKRTQALSLISAEADHYTRHTQQIIQATLSRKRGKAILPSALSITVAEDCQQWIDLTKCYSTWHLS